MTNQYITLYHTFLKEPTKALSFDSANGFCVSANSIGRGWGGQKSGFYCFTSRTDAENMIHNRKDKENKYAWIAEISVEQGSLKYPEWEFDYEFSSSALKLIHKYADTLEGKGILSCFETRFKGDDLHEVFFTLHPQNRPGVFTVKRYRSDSSSVPMQVTEGVKASSHGIANVAIFQKVNDILCEESKDYLKNYNALLNDIKAGSSDSLKYTGNKPLSVISLDICDIKNPTKFNRLYQKGKPGCQIDTNQRFCLDSPLYKTIKQTDTQKLSLLSAINNNGRT